MKGGTTQASRCAQPTPNIMARKAARALGDPAEAAARHLREGRHRAAAAAVLPVLLLRAGDGDAACSVAAALLQHGYHPASVAGSGSPVVEDKLAQTVERLVRLVRQQDEQLAALLDLLETP